MKTFLITGATKGIGFAISSKLAFQKNQIIGIARNAINDFPGDLYTCDLIDENETQKTLGEIISKYSIDGIINNAGIASPQLLGSINLKTVRDVFALNVIAAIQITQFFVKGMQEKNWGRIINIASRAVQGAIERTSYSAAKSGLLGCTKTWALELAKFNITVNAIAPGPIETESLRKTRSKGSVEEKEALQKIPMGRFGTTEEVADLACFLLSPSASYITGQIIFIDGGKSLSK